MIKLSSINGAKIFAKDGDVGRIKDIYFDDRDWAVRYFVADTGGWLTGQRVLLSPLGLDRMANGRITATLTRRQIEESPSIAEHEPISREYERRYYAYFNWPYYWTGQLSTVGAPHPEIDSSAAAGARGVSIGDVEPGEPHLRSAGEVRGYHFHATDGSIGHVEDFLLDETDWIIRYLVVDTKNWWPGKIVLLSPHWISQVDWSRAAVDVRLTRDAIKTAPAYDPTASWSRKYEERLFEHYDREPYWAEHARERTS